MSDRDQGNVQHTTVYECGDCGHRVMVDHQHRNTTPTVYCGCGEFQVMEVADELA